MLHNLSKHLQNKYKIIAWFYDFLDYPWEREYRQWRPDLLKDVKGKVLEAGVGTGRNFAYYQSDVELTAIDLSPQMLSIASWRAKKAKCSIKLRNIDASTMETIADSEYDWLISTFLCCVMPDELQALAIEQFVRILKPGGRFRILEIIYSNEPKQRRFQKKISPIVEWLYGARFDRKTLKLLKAHSKIKIISTRFLKNDTYLLIDGVRTLGATEQPTEA